MDEPTSQSFKTAIFDMMIESQHWSADQMLAYQRSQLEQLLRHARSTVPFYETRLDCLFTRHGDVDWSKWNAVPILSRKDVAEQFDALQSSALPPGHGKTKISETSGSTGVPIKSSYTKLLSDVCLAADWRAHLNWGLDWSQPAMYWQKLDEKQERLGAGHNYGMWGPPHLDVSRRGSSFAIDTGYSIDESLKQLRDCKTQYLFSQGNLPFSAALNLQQRNETFPLKAIASHGVELDEQMVSTLRSTFNAELFAMYSSKEGGRMAHTCRTCFQYHINTEAVHIEILDSDNQPCRPGVQGRVIVTNFFNAAQPFIRYEQGDLATMAEACACGTKKLTLASIDGRVYHLFKRRSGERFAPFVFDGYREKLGAKFWQFVQATDDHVVVKYKPATQRDIDRERNFAGLLRELLMEDFEIDFEVVEELPLTASGKFIKYVYAVP